MKSGEIAYDYPQLLWVEELEFLLDEDTQIRKKLAMVFEMSDPPRLLKGQFLPDDTDMNEWDPNNFNW